MHFFSTNSDVLYLSVLGINFRLGKFGKLGVFDEQTTDSLIDYLEEYNSETIVFDCTAMVYKDDQKVFERFFNLQKYKDRKIVFFNLEKELYKRIKTDLNISVFPHEFNSSNIYFHSDEIMSVGINENSIFELIADDFKTNDVKILKNCANDHNENPFQLPSTPFWTNYYFDISKLFLEKPLEAIWILSRLIDKFRFRISPNKSILIVSTSLYGTIISTLMKEVLNDSYKVETICFDRLGPDLFLNEASIQKKDSYDYVVYVCDLIIGGTELKILKALLSLRKLSVNYVFAMGTRLNIEEYNFDSLVLNNIFKTSVICEDIYYTFTKPEKK